MLFHWFGKGTQKPSAPRRQISQTKPQVESLEERCSPTAIRMLPGYTAFNLGHIDDEPSQQARLGFNINFFGVQTNNVFVNNNGNITFNQAFPNFTPTALNTDNGGIPIIAPFFADVDTRPANSPVVTYGTETLCGRATFGVDYINVGYFENHLVPTNSFQVILIDRSDTGAGNFDIEFNYDNIQWESGDASGGTNGLGGESARVGYTNGTGAAGTFFELPGSGVNGAFLNTGPNALVNTSIASSTPGRLHFLVRDGQVVQAPKVNNDVSNSVEIFYPFRYDVSSASSAWTGNLTLVNSARATGTNACLDITSGDKGGIAGPFNVVFTSLPSNVQLTNATGVTASGNPYLTFDVSSLPAGGPPAREQIQLFNPTSVPTTTFALGYQAKVYAGQFDPTML